MASRRRFLILSIVVVALLLAAWVFYNMLFGDTIESAARRASNCLAEADGGCLYNFLTSDDIRAYDLDREKFESLVEKYYLPAVKGAEWDAPQCEVMSEQQQAICTQGLRQGDRPIQSVAVFVSQTEEGIRSPYLVSQLLLTVAVLIAQPKAEPVGGIRKIQAWLEQAETDGPKLRELGINGIYRESSEGLIPWAQWQENCRKKLEAAEAASVNARSVNE
jgi:hypothetical protein